MTVPETAVDKHGRPVFREDDVGLSRKVGCVQTVAEPQLPQSLPDENFRLCVLAADVRHTKMPLLQCQFVGHYLKRVWKLMAI